MKIKIILISILSFLYIVANSQNIEVLENPLFNGPEGIIFDEETNQYYVGNATDGKLLIIDSLHNVSIFKDSIGANMIMSFEILGDSLFISTNYPRTLTCINKLTGDSIYQVNLDTMASSCSQMAYDSTRGYIYIVDQTGGIIKADANEGICEPFVTTGLSQGSQSIEIDKENNRLVLFCWSDSRVKYIDLNDSSNITFGPSTGSMKYSATVIDNQGFIYASSWSGNKVKKMHIDSLDNASTFCSDSLYQPVGITLNKQKEIVAVCNYGANNITFIPFSDTSTLNTETGYIHKNSEFGVYYNNMDKTLNISNVENTFSYLKIIDLVGRIIWEVNNIAISEESKFKTPELQTGIYIYQLADRFANVASGKFYVK